MIANADKFQVIILEKGSNDTSGMELSINNATVTSSKEVKLLGLTIDCKLSFSKHISNICKQAANKLNVIKRFQKHISERNVNWQRRLFYRISTSVILFGIIVEMGICII